MQSRGVVLEDVARLGGCFFLVHVFFCDLNVKKRSIYDAVCESDWKKYKEVIFSREKSKRGREEERKQKTCERKRETVDIRI